MTAWSGLYPSREAGYARGVLADLQTPTGTLGDLRAQAAGCTACSRLVGARRAVVPSAGTGSSGLVLVTGGPRGAEDAAGELLVGPGGRLLDELLGQELGLGREDVVVTAAVRCRTPQGRAPAPSEVRACASWLEAEVALAQAVVVCALGGLAARALRGRPAPIRALRGRPEELDLGGRPVHLVALFDPEAALYAEGAVELLREDLRLVGRLLAQGRPAVPEPVALAGVEDSGEPGQLPLF